MVRTVGRRQFLTAAANACLSGALVSCAAGMRETPRGNAALPTLSLEPLHASTDRITNITVCRRPFRPQGPRLDVEPLMGKTVVHNYGHGGSGWSLSWGSSAIAVEKALMTGDRQVGVVGCGAMGLTSALLLQQAGAQVTIYTKELPPATPSFRATGLWAPDSRICFEPYATAEFKEVWEGMARQSFATYQNYLGLPGRPVEFIDFYLVTDAWNRPPRPAPTDETLPRFAGLQQALLGDLSPRTQQFAPGQHPLGPHYLQAHSRMMFNLPSYIRTLMSDFRDAGGRIQIEEFHTPADLVRVRERTLINATGYGSRSLFHDQSLVPIRGQLARAIPQMRIDYGLQYRDALFAPRRDGFVFQVIGLNDYYGFNDDTTEPDRSEAEHAVQTIAELFSVG